MSDDSWGEPLPEWVEAYQETGFVSCDLLHPGTTCIHETLGTPSPPSLTSDIMKRIVKKSISLYVVIHGLPVILFKRRDLRRK